MALTVGTRAQRSHTVTGDDTAIALGSGDVPVLGTPRALAWCEEASVLAVADGLEPGSTTVGVHVDLEHLLASPVGAQAVAEAVVHAVDGRRVVVTVRLTDADGRLLAAGRVTRAIVDRERFLRMA